MDTEYKNELSCAKERLIFSIDTLIHKTPSHRERLLNCKTTLTTSNIKIPEILTNYFREMCAFLRATNSESSDLFNLRLEFCNAYAKYNKLIHESDMHLKPKNTSRKKIDGFVSLPEDIQNNQSENKKHIPDTNDFTYSSKLNESDQVQLSERRSNDDQLASPIEVIC